jgi:hypothetical protein
MFGKYERKYRVGFLLPLSMAHYGVKNIKKNVKTTD